MDSVAMKTALPAAYEDEDEFPEGKVLYRQHRTRERNRNLVEQVKNQAAKEGQLRCSACGFDFNQVYGDLGKGYIECHHTVPISEYADRKTTKISELALVCSNCHAMLHRRRPWLSIWDLSAAIKPASTRSHSEG
jgi:5-methylcytosine-specific restriction protein A